MTGIEALHDDIHTQMCKEGLLSEWYVKELTTFLGQIITTLNSCPDLNVRTRIAGGIRLVMDNQLRMIEDDDRLAPMQYLRFVSRRPRDEDHYRPVELVDD